MRKKIAVLDVSVDDCNAKDAMKWTVEYMETEAASLVELITIDTLMKAREDERLRGYLEHMDLLIPGDKEILEAAGHTDKRCLRNVEEHTYLRMILRYLQRNHKRVFLLVESDEEGKSLYSLLSERYQGIQITGMAKVAMDASGDDLVVNAINGEDVDCVIATMSAPIGERFVSDNRQVLNVRVWLGVGSVLMRMHQTCSRKSQFFRYILHHIFKREMKKMKK